MKKAIGFIKKHEKKLFAIDALAIIILIIFLGQTKVPAHVKGVKAESTYSSAVLTWQKSEDADGYRVFRSNDGRKFEYIDSTVDNQYTDENLTTGDTYYYAIAARNGIKRNQISPAEAVKVVPSLETPKLSVDVSNGIVELNISEVKGATSYSIIRDGVEISKSKETKYIDEKAKPDVVHNYKVKAIRHIDKNRPVSSGSSNTIETELHQIPGFEIKATESDISFEWAENEHYSTYTLYDGDTKLVETEDTSYTVDDYDMDKVYDIKLVGTDSEKKMKSPAIEERFKVTEAPMDNEAARQAACDWAIMIAADDTFSYGAPPRAWHCGCYFCGTNTKRKGAGYEKTYCCNPFVNAAYAHGAGDPEILRLCQKGGSLGMDDNDYKKYGDWKNVGKPSIDDLEMGDVLVASSHVMLYTGDGAIVHASGGGWGPNSIREDKCSSYYGMVKFVERYEGSGNGTMYKVVKVDEKGNPIETEASDKET